MAKRPPRALDDIDYALLALVQEDWPRTSEELRSALEKRNGHTLTGGACHNRIVSLRDRGYIKKSSCALNAKDLRVPQVCFMIVHMRQKDTKTLEEFISAVSANDAVQEIFEMGGLCDYLIKVRVPDMEEALRLSKVFSGTIAEIQTHPAGQAHKETTAISLSYSLR